MPSTGDTLLEYLESHDSLSLREMVRSLSARYVPVEELKTLDPDLRTFTNINKLEDLDRINARTRNHLAQIHSNKIIITFTILWLLTTAYINIWDEVNTILVYQIPPSGLAGNSAGDRQWSICLLKIRKFYDCSS